MNRGIILKYISDEWLREAETEFPEISVEIAGSVAEVEEWLNKQLESVPAHVRWATRFHFACQFMSNTVAALPQAESDYAATKGPGESTIH